MMSVRPPRYRAMLESLAARLAATAHDGVLKPGDEMPDFLLPDTAGELVFSDDLLARGVIASRRPGGRGNRRPADSGDANSATVECGT